MGTTTSPLTCKKTQSSRGRHLELKTILKPAVMACLLAVLDVAPAAAATDPIQSPARPFGLQIDSPVYQSGSDQQAVSFQQNALPTLDAWIKKNLPEYTAIKDFSSMTLDPSMLTVKTTQDVRVYFIGEGAGYQNTLGYNTSSTGIKSGNPELIFPNASSSVSSYATASQIGSRTKADPLIPGDYVDLGTMQAGTQLDFFMIANGASGGSNVFSTTTSANPDGIRHVVAYASKDSPYLLLGFEDMLGGGDRDYNDVLIAVKGLQMQLTTAPEPSTLLILGTFLLPVLYLGRQHYPRTAREACA